MVETTNKNKQENKAFAMLQKDALKVMNKSKKVAGIDMDSIKEQLANK